MKRLIWIALLILSLTAFVIGSVNASPPSGLVLWNKLGSDTEVLTSAFGPDLAFFTGTSDRTQYVPGIFENATTLDGGPYGSGQRVHNLVLNNANLLLNPEQGAIEMWYKQTSDPVPFSHGIYRLFDGDFGLDSGMGLESFTPLGGSPRLFFILTFGGTRISIDHDISANNGNWIHIAAAWNRTGIDGSTDTMRLYVNGVQVASTAASSWGTTVGSQADIAGGNDANIVGKFFVDNLKVWNVAKTDYSDRFVEDFLQPVDIDIKPRNSQNLIAQSSRFIPVAILSTASFNAVAEIDSSTLTFGRTGGESSLHRCDEYPTDINRDLREDLVCYFLTHAANIQPGTTIGILKGKTHDGITTIVGQDMIKLLAAP